MRGEQANGGGGLGRRQCEEARRGKEDGFFTDARAVYFEGDAQVEMIAAVGGEGLSEVEGLLANALPVVQADSDTPVNNKTSS